MSSDKPDNSMRYFWILTIIAIIIIASTFVYVMSVTDAHFKKIIADDNAKSQLENNTLHMLNCKQLGDWLVTDKWFDRDNLIWAQNHYLVSCK